MKFAPDERETICRCDESDKKWTVWTSSKGMMAKLSKIKQPRIVQQDSDGIYAMTLDLDFNQVSFRNPSRRKGHTPSPEQIARMQEARRKKAASE